MIFFRKNPIISSIIGAILLYLFSLGALLLAATQKGSLIFSKNILFKTVYKPLTMTPRLYSWALFIGYFNRFLKSYEIKYLPKHIYGLPITINGQKKINQNIVIDNIIENIISDLEKGNHIYIYGGGGSGKSTLLSTIGRYIINTKINNIKYKPILITATYYQGNLLESISKLWRQKFGMYVTDEIVETQLQTGGFIILIDGLSEMGNKVTQELKQVIHNINYKNNLFLFSSRNKPSNSSKATIIHLNPINREFIDTILKSLKLNRQEKNNITTHIKELKDIHSLSPLLLDLIIAKKNTLSTSYKENKLFEDYFKSLLKIESYEDWKGWNYILSYIAYWLMIEPNKRGLGLSRIKLIDKMGKYSIKGNVQKYFGLKVEEAADIVFILKKSGIINEHLVLKFSHDVFEEYFAAYFIMMRKDVNKEEQDICESWIQRNHKNEIYSRVFKFQQQF